MAFTYERRYRGELQVTRDLLRRLDDLVARSSTVDPEALIKPPEGRVHFWQISFADSITASEQKIDYLLTLRDQDFRSAQEIVVRTSVACEQTIRISIDLTSHPGWSANFRSNVNLEASQFKLAFEDLAAEMQNVEEPTRFPREHYERSFDGPVCVSPDALRRIDRLFANSLTFGLSDAKRRIGGSSHTWTVVFSNNRKALKKTLDEILALQNSRGEQITTLRASVAPGADQSISFGIRSSGYAGATWDVEFEGAPEEVTVFVSAFEPIAKSLTPPLALIRTGLFQLALIGLLAFISAYFVGVVFTGEAFTFSQKAALTLLLLMPFLLAYWAVVAWLWRSLFPKFSCFIGDGEGRENQRKGWRLWLGGIITSLLLSAFVGLLTLPISAREEPKSPEASEPTEGVRVE